MECVQCICVWIGAMRGVRIGFYQSCSVGRVCDMCRILGCGGVWGWGSWPGPGSEWVG